MNSMKILVGIKMTSRCYLRRIVSDDEDIIKLKGEALACYSYTPHTKRRTGELPRGEAACHSVLCCDSC